MMVRSPVVVQGRCTDARFRRGEWFWMVLDETCGHSSSPPAFRMMVANPHRRLGGVLEVQPRGPTDLEGVLFRALGSGRALGPLVCRVGTPPAWRCHGLLLFVEVSLDGQKIPLVTEKLSGRDADQVVHTLLANAMSPPLPLQMPAPGEGTPFFPAAPATLGSPLRFL